MKPHRVVISPKCGWAGCDLKNACIAPLQNLLTKKRFQTKSLDLLCEGAWGEYTRPSDIYSFLPHVNISVAISNAGGRSWSSKMSLTSWLRFASCHRSWVLAYLIRMIESAPMGAFAGAPAAVWILNTGRILPGDKAISYGPNPQLTLKYPILTPPSGMKLSANRDHLGSS